MRSVAEAIEFFRSRGFFASELAAMDSDGFLVGVAQEPPETPDPGQGYSEDDIRIVRCGHEFLPGESWTVRGEDMTEQQFGSLADAANAVLARLQAWLAANPAEGP